MITIREARIVVLERAREAGVLRGERVAVGDATGRVLAGGVASDTDLPPFDRVMMDGFAVRAADAAEGAALPVEGEVAAGDAGELPLAAGTARAIMTGAPLPPGADAVVPIEWVEREDGGVRLSRGVASGQHVAPRGQDIARGDAIAEAGTVVSAMNLSLLIAAGVGEVEVVARPRVAVLATGSELVAAGAPIRRGQIRESNGAALCALFRGLGAEVENLGVARDDEGALAAALDRAEDADVVVLTGGSSVGKYDLTPDVVEARGAVRHFDRLSVKPGKPTLFHTLGARQFFCLPGNPVAALMTGRVLVGAALAARGGRAVADFAGETLPLAAPVRRHPARDLMIPMRRAEGALVFDGWHGSGDVRCMARADGFAFVARGEGEAPAGTPADFFATDRGATAP